MRKKVRSPKLRVMLKVAEGRYEWHSPTTLSEDDLELCSVVVFTDFQTGGEYIPILL